MATYVSGASASTVQSRGGVGFQSVAETYEAAVALALNDVIQMVKVPAGATIMEVILSVDDLDSGANLVLDVGDGTTSGRFISGSTIGQAGGTVRLGSGVTGAAAADCANYLYTAEDTIDVKVTTAPAGGGTGTLTMTVLYSMQNAV